MQLYFAVPDTATTHDGVLVRSFLRQCAVSTDLARAVKFRGGGFFADGVPVLANRRIYPGQMLSFALPPEGDGVTPQPEIPVNVVYEDAFAVVLEKPPQLAVHPTLNYPGGTLAGRRCTAPGKALPCLYTPRCRMASGWKCLCSCAPSQWKARCRRIWKRSFRENCVKK